jgi:hypothetical protein
MLLAQVPYQVVYRSTLLSSRQYLSCSPLGQSTEMSGEPSDGLIISRTIGSVLLVWASLLPDAAAVTRSGRSRCRLVRRTHAFDGQPCRPEVLQCMACMMMWCTIAGCGRSSSVREQQQTLAYFHVHNVYCAYVLINRHKLSPGTPHV